MTMKDAIPDEYLIDELEQAIKRAIAYSQQTGVGGQTVTVWVCPGCGEDQVHGSTAHGSLCKACAIILRQTARGIARTIIERKMLGLRAAADAEHKENDDA